MSNLVFSLLSALLATNTPAAVSNLVTQQTGLHLTIPDPNDPVEQRYHALLAEDDAAQTEIDRWIRSEPAMAPLEASLAKVTLRARIRQRMDPVRQHYEDFIQHNPKHVRARIAYGSFLNDLGEEQEARQQWEKALEVEPKNPAIWNNLGNFFAHNGPIRQAFEDYGKALELDPEQSLYYQNLATIMYMFRKDAEEFYKISPTQVYKRVLRHYRKALDLDPKNFPLATDLAQTYYGFKPPSTGDDAEDRELLIEHYEEALTAWDRALRVAHDDIEREGVYTHLARVQIELGRLEEARRQLTLVTNAMYFTLRNRLLKKIEQKSKPSAAPSTHAPAPATP